MFDDTPKILSIEWFGDMASAPDSIPLNFFIGCIFAERIINGICIVCLLLLSCLIKVIPSILGIIMSVMIRSGVFFVLIKQALLHHFSAVKMEYSSDSISFSIHSNSLLSSIIRMVVSGWLNSFFVITSFSCFNICIVA